MKKITYYLRKKRVWGSILILAIAAFFIFGKGKDVSEKVAVVQADVVDQIVLSGSAKTRDRADLGFASSGRVQKIAVTNNQDVHTGEMLAQLEIGDLLAERAIKQAAVQVEAVDLEGAKKDLERVRAQQDTKVESAYRTLLSEGLAAVPDSDTYTVAPPVITGIYDGGEGQYDLYIDKEDATDTDLVLRTYNLEKTKSVTIQKNEPTKMGTRGLFVSFPDTIADYQNTKWYITIPNTKSTAYLANYNAWNEAKHARDIAVQDAEFKYKKIVAEQQTSATSAAYAEIEKIDAAIRKSTIYAPFNGKVSNIQKEVGESAGVGETIISVLGEGALEIVLQVPELDVSKLVTGAKIAVTFDAIPGETFEGTISTINSKDTEVDGVPIYEAFVEVAPDPRIKTGMSAYGKFEIARKDGVLAIPAYLITKEGDASFVTVLDKNDKEKKVTVTTGIKGSDSMIEITSGLSLGDIVIGAVKK